MEEIDLIDTRPSYWFIITVGIVAFVLVVGFIGWLLYPSGLKPRLIEAVERATGRTLTIAGDTRIKFSLTPTVSMDDVTLSNPPGFSRPEMVKIEHVEVGLAILPLLDRQFEVDHVTLVRPDILLETDPAGRANWVFSREAAQPQRPQAQNPQAQNQQAQNPQGQNAAVAGPGDAQAKQRLAVMFRNASVVEGRIGWIDGRSGRHDEALLPQLALAAPSGEPARLSGSLTYRGRHIELTGRAEPTDVSGSDPGSGPWPVDLKLESGDASVTVDGQIDQPLASHGYALTIDADVPDPSIFAPLFPELPLTLLKSITAHAELSASGVPNPTISALRVKVASADISKLGIGATMEDITLGAGAEGPIRFSARVTRDGFDSGINGNIGDLAWLAAGASGPLAVDLEWNAASARASIKGTIEAPAKPSGFALDVALDVPRPSQVMDDAPPGLRAVTFRTRLTDAPGPMAFQLNSSAGDLTGALTVTRLPKPSVARVSVVGEVSSQRLDLDMLLARPTAAASSGTVAPAEPGSSGAPPSEATGAVVPGGSAAPSEASNPAASGPIAASAPNQSPLIPDRKLPFDMIRRIEGNVKLAFGDVRLDGVDIRKIDGVAAVTDGQLRLDPFTIAAPDQQLSGHLTADAAKTPPMVHLAVNAPALAVQPLLGILGLPQIATGNAAVQADLTGTGESSHAIAASLNGWAGIALEGGQLDTRVMNAWLSQVQPLHFSGPDVTDLRCFAIRADVKSGVATIRPVALNTPALIVDGSGDVDLKHETLALQLRPRTKIGGTGIAVPVRVSGPIREPSARIDISGKGLGGILGGLMIGGKDVMGAAGGGDPCPSALASVRQGAAGEPAAPGPKP